MASKTFTGARAVIRVDNEIVAIAQAYSYTLNTPLEPIHLLGRFSAAETVYTSQEVINLSVTGVRLINQGPHGTAKVTKLQDLLNAEDAVITVGDRQQQTANGAPMATFIGCKSTGYSSGVAQKGTQTLNINYMALYMQDESGDQAESPGAVELP